MGSRQKPKLAKAFIHESDARPKRGQVVKRTPLVRWSQAGCLMEVTWNMVKRNSLFWNSPMSWRQWVFYFRKFSYTKHANKEQALLDGFRKDKAFSSTSCKAVQFKMVVNIGVWSGMGRYNLSNKITSAWNFLVPNRKWRAIQLSS